MLAVWYPREIDIKTKDSHVNIPLEDESKTDEDVEQQQSTVTEEAISLFEIIDKALINVCKKHV